jgi:hypothetical protein
MHYSGFRESIFNTPPLHFHRKGKYVSMLPTSV